MTLKLIGGIFVIAVIVFSMICIVGDYLIAKWFEYKTKYSSCIVTAAGEIIKNVQSKKKEEVTENEQA